MTTPAKHCTSCGKFKVMDAFARNCKSKDGRNSWCKECKNNWYREHRAEQALFCRLRRQGFVAPRAHRRSRTFADAIRKARLKKNISIGEAARRIGIGENTLSGVELRKHDTGRATARAIVQFYNLPPSVMVLP